MQPADAAVTRRMNISSYAAKWRRHALTQISLRQMRGQFTSQITGEERFDEKEEDTESKISELSDVIKFVASKDADEDVLESCFVSWRCTSSNFIIIMYVAQKRILNIS
ncbi:hypothetical protein M8J77_002986 [Diaphorina citri]|nr:hypothetical protein M8J77_002986 [Diaphorina citri]